MQAYDGWWGGFLSADQALLAVEDLSSAQNGFDFAYYTLNGWWYKKVRARIRLVQTRVTISP